MTHLEARNDSQDPAPIPFSYVVFSVAGVFLMLCVILAYAVITRNHHMTPERMDREARAAIRKGEALTPEHSDISAREQDSTSKR